MRRFYVEYICNDLNQCLYIFADSKDQIEEMFQEYKIVAVDETE